MKINDIFVRVDLFSTYENVIKKFINNLVVKEISDTEDCAIEIVPYINKYEKYFHMLEKKYFYIYDKNIFGMFDENNRKILIDCNNAPNSFNIYCEENFKPFQLIRLFEWCLHICMSARGYAFIHGMSFGKNNKAFIFPAWKATGKTTAFVHAVEDRMDFIGDDWCIVDAKANVYPYLKNAFLYKKDLMELDFLQPSLLNWFERLLLKFKLPIHVPAILDCSKYKLSKTKYQLGSIVLLSRYGERYHFAKCDTLTDNLFGMYLFEHSIFTDSNRVRFMLKSSTFIDEHYARVHKIYQSIGKNKYHSLEFPSCANGKAIYELIKERVINNAD